MARCGHPETEARRPPRDWGHLETKASQEIAVVTITVMGFIEIL